MSKKQKYTFIDLFAGAGGLSEGFIKAGYEALAHVEMDKYACQSLKTRAAFHWLDDHQKLDVYENYLRNKKENEDGSKLWGAVPSSVTDKVIQAAIGDDTIQQIFHKIDTLIEGRTLDLIVGGPPCQAYSYAGRARLGKEMEKDPRNELYLYYVQFLDRYKPQMFVFENVMGIRDAKGGGPFQDLKKRVRALGYEIEDRTQIASDFGVLQKRERVIIIGWRKENENGNSTSYHYPELRVKPSKYQVMKDLFADLPIRNAGEGTMNGIVNYTKGLKEMPYLKESGIRGKMSFTTEHVVRPLNDNDREIYLIAVNLWKEGVRLHYAKLPERLQKHKNKHKFSNRFCVVNPNGVSHTLVAHIAMDGHYYIYPVEKPTLENVRSISVREAARIQTFPDDFFFEGPRTAALKQIGNAVPVMLAYNIAKELKKQLL